MPNKTDPLSGELNAPGDYQRPVATRGAGADVFGQAARFVNQLDNAWSSGRGASGPSATEQENLAVKRGLDEFAQGAHEIMTGRSGKQSPKGFDVSVLESYGADVGSSLAELKRIQSAQEAGGMDKTLAEVQTERLVSGMIGKHPEIAYEVLGEGLSKLGIDHAYARNFKAQQALDQSVTDTLLAAHKGYAELYVKTGMPTEGMTYAQIAQAGQKLAREEYNYQELLKQRTADKALFEANKAESAQEAEQRKKKDERIDGDLVNSVMGKAAIVYDVTLSDFRGFKFVGATDATLTGDMATTIDAVLSRLATDKLGAATKLRADGVLPEKVKMAEEWFDQHIKLFEELRTGSGANVNLVTDQVKMLTQLNILESREIMPTYLRLKDMFGQDLLGNILAGTMPGFPPETIKDLQQELVKSLTIAQGDTAKINKAAMDFQAILKGANLEYIDDPKLRKDAVLKAAVGLVGATEAMKPGKTPAAQTKENFANTSVSLANLIVGEGKSISPDDVQTGLNLMFNAKWRGAVYEYAKSNPDQADMIIRYNGVATGAALDSVVLQARGAIAVDSTTGRYVPVNQTRTYQVKGETVTVPDNVNDGITKAKQANMLLDHLVALNGLGGVQLIPPEALKATDGDGKSKTLTVREVFSSQTSLQESLLRYGNSLNKTKQNTAVEEARANLLKYADPAVMKPIDYGALPTRQAYELTLEAADIEGKSQKYMGNRYVPVDDLTSFIARIGGAESSMNPNIGDHNTDLSTAHGMFGFLKGTWVENVRKIPGNENLSEEDALALRSDRAVELQVMKIFTIGNLNTLRNNLGREVSWDEVDMAHLLGPAKGEGATGFLEALAKNPNMKTKDFFKKLNDEGEVAVIAANPKLTGKGEGTLLQMWNQRLRRQDPDWTAYMQEWHGVSGAQMPKTDFIGDADIEATGAN